jgi:hypothetical protein
VGLNLEDPENANSVSPERIFMARLHNQKMYMEYIFCTLQKNWSARLNTPKNTRAPFFCTA